MPTNRKRTRRQPVGQPTPHEFEVLAGISVPLRRGERQELLERYGDRLPQLLLQYVLQSDDPERLLRAWKYNHRSGTPLPAWWPR